MNSRIFAAFGLGALVASISLGAIQLVSAAGDATITACASKTTGAMRYITKGSCKKTEIRIMWNQQGPQGLPGTKGEAGVTGTKGDRGEAGANGQNLYVVDAAGLTVGKFMGFDNSGYYHVLVRNILWSLSGVVSNQVSLNGYGTDFYQDSSCNVPFVMVPAAGVVNPQLAARSYSSSGVAGDKAYQPVGSALTFTGRNVYTWTGFSPTFTCTALTGSEKTTNDLTWKLYDSHEVVKPTFTAPLAVVQQ